MYKYIYIYPFLSLISISWFKVSICIDTKPVRSIPHLQLLWAIGKAQPRQGVGELRAAHGVAVVAVEALEDAVEMVQLVAGEASARSPQNVAKWRSGGRRGYHWFFWFKSGDDFWWKKGDWKTVMITMIMGRSWETMMLPFENADLFFWGSNGIWMGNTLWPWLTICEVEKSPLKEKYINHWSRWAMASSSLCEIGGGCLPQLVDEE